MGTRHFGEERGEGDVAVEGSNFVSHRLQFVAFGHRLFGPFDGSSPVGNAVPLGDHFVSKDNHRDGFICKIKSRS